MMKRCIQGLWQSGAAGKKSNRQAAKSDSSLFLLCGVRSAEQRAQTTAKPGVIVWVVRYKKESLLVRSVRLACDADLTRETPSRHASPRQRCADAPSWDAEIFESIMHFTWFFTALNLIYDWCGRESSCWKTDIFALTTGVSCTWKKAEKDFSHVGTSSTQIVIFLPSIAAASVLITQGSITATDRFQ